MRIAFPRVVFAVPPLTPLQSLIARRWRPQWMCSRCQHRSLQHRGLATSERSPASEKPYYITTPIFYVNAEPHVGHMYTMILTDVLKRWQELKGRKAILCTGTDEHGLKIQQAAAKAGIEPELFCDRGAEEFRNLATRIGISYDIFMRTTSRKHRESAEHAWHMLQEHGYIYESKHEGWYSVSDETFYPKSQIQLVVDPPTGRKMMVSIETGKEVEWTSERNYHFRLSAFREKLLEFYQANPNFVVPAARMNDVVEQVTAGLEDLSVSRPVERLSWGIRVPTDSSQTMYVWLDALLNYASAVGYPFAPDQESAGGWPADVHVVGKDIVRFHCIYWPAFLMALGVPLPKQVLTHAHWTLGRQKMAKSTGNVISPFFALERFGLDAMRWYLVHEGGIADDANYDNSFVREKYKKGLQDGLGNLGSRIMRSKLWSVRDAVRLLACHSGTGAQGGLAPISHEASFDDEDKAFHTKLATLPEAVDGQMRILLPNRALQTLMEAVYHANGHLQQAKPWKLAAGQKQHSTTIPDQSSKDSPGSQLSPTPAQRRVASIIFLNAEALRLVGIMLQPFIPTSAARLLDMLGVEPERRSWQFCQIGADDSYGEPLEDIGTGEKALLFPAMRTFL